MNFIIIFVTIIVFSTEYLNGSTAGNNYITTKLIEMKERGAESLMNLNQDISFYKDIQYGMTDTEIKNIYGESIPNPYSIYYLIYPLDDYRISAGIGSGSKVELIKIASLSEEKVTYIKLSKEHKYNFLVAKQESKVSKENGRELKDLEFIKYNDEYYTIIKKLGEPENIYNDGELEVISYQFGIRNKCYIIFENGKVVEVYLVDIDNNQYKKYFIEDYED